MNTSIILHGLAGLSFILTLSTAAQDSVWLSITNRSGVGRTNDWVAGGIPLPRSWQVTEVSQLRLLREDSTPLPAQFEILGRWGGDRLDAKAPAKWVFVSCFGTAPAQGSTRVRLEKTAGPIFPPSGITIRSAAPNRLTIDTGAAVFEINTNAFNLFEQVTVAGLPMLRPLSPTEALAYRDMNGTSVVAATIQPPPRRNRIRIERTGPLYAVIKIEGSLLDARQRAILDYTARCHFFAGQTTVRLDFTVENNLPVLAGESNEPLNVHNQGSTNSVYLGGLKLALRLAESPAPLHVNMEAGVSVTSPASPIRLYQDSSGTDFWDTYVGPAGWESNMLCAPRLQSYCTKPGFEISGAGKTLTGRQALGWATVYRSEDRGPRLELGLRDFWQNFPKAIEIQTNGLVAIDLFPNGEVFRHNLRVGEEKTHTVLLHFGIGPEAAEISAQRARTFNSPLWLHSPSDWFSHSKALGEVPMRDVSRWPLYEHYVEIAFTPNPDFNPEIHDPNFSNSTLREVIERYNFFGWQDYGDVPLDYEAFGPQQAGQMNLKYWYLHGMLAQYARSNDERWLDLALPAAWHLADIDYLHIPDPGIQHWVHGGYFGHSNHDEPGNLNPNRNSNSPSIDLFFGVPDLLLAYHLTGEERFREVALEGLEAMVNQSQFGDFTAPYLYRERANLIFGYLEGYRHTGEDRWLTALHTLVGETAKLSNKPWLNNPTSFRPEENWHWLSSFSLSQILWTLGRYLDFCEEYDLRDNLGVTQALTAYSDFILRHFSQEYRPGRMATWNAFYFYDPHEDPYLEINDWALVTADALAYASKYSGRTNYLEAAGKFYATGTIDQVWEDDAPVYMATKDLVNALNWGLVYMQQSQSAIGPPTTPRLRIQSHSANQTILQWDLLPSPVQYTVEATSSLFPPFWTVVSGAQPIGTNSWVDNHGTIPRRFWRLRVEP